MQKTEPSKGFLVVASKTHRFYSLAINLIESIKDYYPDAKICLVTEERFCDGRESIADHLIFCGDRQREKLWALPKTPFDITMYIDADVSVQHEDIQKVFDHIENADLVFTELESEASKGFAVASWPGGEMKLSGGIVLYDIRNPLVKEFMTDWYEYYYKQVNLEWWPDYKNGTPDFKLHPMKLKQWDQFTLWWLTEKNPKYKNLKMKIFEDSYRWNWYSIYNEKELSEKINPENKPPIIFHWSHLVNKGELYE